MKTIREMTKRERKQYFNQQRMHFDMNTGTRIHKTKKEKSDEDWKKDIRKYLDN